MDFKLVAGYKPTGDQPEAIEALAIFPKNKYKDSLIALLDYAINRVK